MKHFIISFCAITALILHLPNAAAKDGVVYTSNHGHAFINGGISEEEASLIRRTAKDFSLQLLFSLGQGGAWISDVSVMILDGSGTQTVFTKKVAGPLLYINLPAGDYQIVGSYNGVRQSKRFTLADGEKPRRLILNWKDDSEEYATNSRMDTEETTPQ